MMGHQVRILVHHRSIPGQDDIRGHLDGYGADIWTVYVWSSGRYSIGHLAALADRSVGR